MRKAKGYVGQERTRDEGKAEEEEEGEGADEEAQESERRGAFRVLSTPCTSDFEDDDNVSGEPARRGGEVRFATGASYE